MSANREALGWDYMTPESRLSVMAHSQGVSLNRYAQQRISNSSWAALSDHERTCLFRVDWKFVLLRIPLLERVESVMREYLR
jgi:hypothetical protein